MAGRRRKQQHEEHVNHERWLVSYADMVTLLMCLFIVLFAMATVDQKKFAALAESLRGGGEAAAATVLEGSDSVVDGGEIGKLETDTELPSVEFELPTVDSPEALAAKLKAQEAVTKESLERQQKIQAEVENLESIKREIQSALLAKGQEGSVKFERTSRGLVITVVTDAVLFDVGRAEIRPQAGPLLDALGIPLRNISNDIVVEGHTDSTPLRGSGQFPTNWELSTARATSVLRYLVEKEGVPASKIGALGYGQERPIASNADRAGQSLNRRVEVVVLSSVGSLE